MTYYLRGEAGDIICAMPAIIAKSGGGTIICGLNIELYLSLKTLVDSQPGFTLEHESTYGFPKETINLEGFRYVRNWKYQHISQSFAEILDVKIDILKPWLTLKISPLPSMVITNITSRYKDRFFSWNKEILSIIKPKKRVYFIGTLREWCPYTKLTKYIGTPDFLTTAYYLKNSITFSANQSCCLSIAQGLGIPYRMQISPSCPGTQITGRDNETILNKHTWRWHFTLARLKEIIHIWKHY